MITAVQGNIVVGGSCGYTCILGFQIDSTTRGNFKIVLSTSDVIAKDKFYNVKGQFVRKQIKCECQCPLFAQQENKLGGFLPQYVVVTAVQAEL